MLYNINGFTNDGDSWSVVAEDGTTVAQHYKDEVSRLGIYDRSDLHHVEVAPGKDQTDVSAGESVSVALRYITRDLDSETGTLSDGVETTETRTFEVELEDPDGQVSSLSFDPTDGEASFSFTPDKVGTWTIRSVTQSENYIDEFATVEGV